MLIAALRDIQWRRRRLVIAIISTGLVFAMTLVLTGLANGFRVEAQRTVDAMGVDAFVVKAGAAGPFLGSTPFAQVDVARVAAAPGVEAAAPLATAASTIREGASARNATAFGAPARGPGMPQASEGRTPTAPDEVEVSSTLGKHIGEDLQVGARTLRIVGIVPNATALAKTPCIFLTTEGLQQLAYNGQPMLTSIGIIGSPRQLPDGYQSVERAAGVNDLLRPLKVAVAAITIVAFLLWIVAVLIVGSLWGDQVRWHRRHRARRPRAGEVSARHGGHRLPGVQSGPQPHRPGERDGSAARRRVVARGLAPARRATAQPRQSRRSDESPPWGPQRRAAATGCGGSRDRTGTAVDPR
jgi:putative ABC transport system permease protein